MTTADVLQIATIASQAIQLGFTTVAVVKQALAADPKVSQEVLDQILVQVDQHLARHRR